MATQAKVQAVNPHHLTAKQLAADRANLKKARAAEKGKPRTAKQKAASRQNLVKARAAQKARRAGKKPVTKKQAKAPLPTGQNIHLLPVCAPVALAAHLRFWTGAEVPDEKILKLHGLLGEGAPVTDVFEAARELGFCGFRPDSWARCDVGTEGVPGLVYGLTVTAGYHAALAVPGGMLSWGMVLPWPAEPEEAWHLEWTALS